MPPSQGLGPKSWDDWDISKIREPAKRCVTISRHGKQRSADPYPDPLGYGGSPPGRPVPAATGHFHRLPRMIWFAGLGGVPRPGFWGCNGARFLAIRALSAKSGRGRWTRRSWWWRDAKNHPPGRRPEECPLLRRPFFRAETAGASWPFLFQRDRTAAAVRHAPAICNASSASRLRPSGNISLSASSRWFIPTIDSTKAASSASIVSVANRSAMLEG